MRIALALALALAAVALFVGPARAATLPAPDLAAWVSQNTDLRTSEVAIAGPDLVYSVQSLGARTPTGEVIVHVQTEAVTASWQERHKGILSWDAHIIFDCNAQRMRVIRSASYPEHRQGGTPKPELAEEGWRTPERAEPAAQLLAAACDPAFAWPLRTTAPRDPAAASPRPLMAGAGAEPQASDPAAGRLYAVQVARGPFETGAKRALVAARRVLDPAFGELIATTEMSRRGQRRRYSALLTGFPSPAAAAQACETLRNAGQACLVRKRDASAGLTRRYALTTRSPAAGPTLQVAHGPFAAGAKRALADARNLLDPAFRGLTSRTETSRLGDRRRYTAVLVGFDSDAAAAQACGLLRNAGQRCILRRRLAPSRADEPKRAVADAHGPPSGRTIRAAAAQFAVRTALAASASSAQVDGIAAA